MLEINIKKRLSHFMLDVSLSVDQEIVVLFGPSGSGKTTILNCIAGLMKPDQGFIRLNKQILFEAKKRNIPIQKRDIGYVFQQYALFPHMTVKKNIEYGIKDKQLVKQLIDVVKINHLLNDYPGNISGGEKQRVSLVRALATKPKVLLLDEPFSALDEKTRCVCHDELLRLHDLWKIPTILVTHQKEEAKKLGERILQIEDGRFT